jgi:RHS repeat-associated protein
MQMISHKAGTTSPYTNRMDLTYDYTAKSAGQMGVGTTAGNAGQLMNISGTINGTTESAAYTYDNYSRLVTSDQTSNGSSAQRRFAYDRWGNRAGVWNATSGGAQIQSVSNQTVSFPGTGSAATNRITGVTSGTTVNYSYDANGNVTSDGVHTYTYDSENRVVSVDSGAASYAYDHQNRRYKTTVGSTVTHYVWQGQNVLAEHNGSTGASLVNYLYAGSRVIMSGPYYLLSDKLSVRLVMNSSAVVKAQQGHLPFGDDFAESGTQQQKQHFTSYERDGQSGTDYAVNRSYSFSVGRFQSADPFQQSAGASAPQTWNRYAYVMNQPADFIDPIGLMMAPPGSGDICGGDGGSGGGGDDEPVSCTVSVYDRLIDSVHGIPIPGARHGYILFTASILGIEIDRRFYEGQKDGQRLIASSATHKKEDGKPGYSPSDRPDRDRKDGEIKGVEICAWIAILEFDVDRVNSVYIRYRLFGPNSSSALRYMLQSLPAQFNMPFMIGYGTKLPGVE